MVLQSAKFTYILHKQTVITSTETCTIYVINVG